MGGGGERQEPFFCPGVFLPRLTGAQAGYAGVFKNMGARGGGPCNNGVAQTVRIHLRGDAGGIDARRHGKRKKAAGVGRADQFGVYAAV